MHDAADPYGKGRVTSRSHHQQHASLTGIRPPGVPYGAPEESSVARKYSPMDTMSPSSPYAAGFRPTGPHAGHGSRQSPTKAEAYSSPAQAYYSSPGMR